MWLFTIYGFYSIACADGQDGLRDPNTIMIRGREKRHLQNLKNKFPMIQEEIITTWNTDYRYRIVLTKAKWVPVLSELAQEQTWANFKNKVDNNSGQCGDDYAEALHKVWETMYGLQPRER